MTAIAELERIAAGAIPSMAATDVVAVVDVKPGGRLPNGSPSGIGVETRFGAAWFDGLRTSPAIAWFDDQRDAYRLIDILKGDRALRSAPRSAAARSQADGPAERGAVPSAALARAARPPGRRPTRHFGRLEGATDDVDAGSPGAPRPAQAEPAAIHGGVSAEPDPGRAGALCKACGRSLAGLPLPRNGQRRQTCDDACRQAFHRGQRAPVPGVVDASDLGRLSRLSRPSHAGTPEGPDPAGTDPQLALLG